MMTVVGLSALLLVNFNCFFYFYFLSMWEFREFG